MEWRTGLRVLLDTHVLLWAARSASELSPKARLLLSQENHTFFVSAVSAWEIATKHRIGKLADASSFIANFDGSMTEAGYKLLPITCRHGMVAGGFLAEHKDPFDRLLVAQAVVDGLVLLSNDKALDLFGVDRVW